MIVSGLPNLFDQYSQYENRVTNALLQALAVSPRLLQSFLREFLGFHAPLGRATVEISAQKQPRGRGDQLETETGAGERDSVPDGWIACEEGDWAVVLESKIQPNTLRLEQLRGHLRAIAAHDRRYLLVLTPDASLPVEVRAAQQGPRPSDGRPGRRFTPGPRGRRRGGANRWRDVTFFAA